MFLRWFSVLLLLAVAILWFGRVEWVARAIVVAPNHGQSAESLLELPREQWWRSDRDLALRLMVGPPAASLSVLVFDPPTPAADGEPKATILVLHGIRDQKLSMVPLGHELAEQGYRAVLVDLRGHGRSSGDWLSFGVLEAEDLVQVLDALAERHLLSPRVGIYGGSYGAATGVQAAARDSRITAVVAVACFSSLGEVVPDFLTHLHLRGFLSTRDIHRALERAGELGGFDPARSCPKAALARTAAHVLLLHGTEDTNIPPAHAERNLAAGQGHTALVLIPGVDHVTIFNDASGELFRQTNAWFVRWFP